MPPTQAEIYGCPEYFGLSRDEITSHESCPSFLRRILAAFPWDGRQSVVQVRPQDFRKAAPEALGRHWHTDINVLLNDGQRRIASSSSELHLMVCSWGGVVGTEFMTTPLTLPDVLNPASNFSPMDLHNAANAVTEPGYVSTDGELVEYTSLDIHRMGPSPTLGTLRLMIVAFDSDQIAGGGKILPSLSSR